MGTDDTVIDVVVARRVSIATTAAPLTAWLERVVASLPAHRDSASGRRNTNQMRAVVFITGLSIVVLWQSPWAPAALVICVGALFLPISESRRRQLVASLRTKQKRQDVTRTRGTLTVNATHVRLACGDETLRDLRRKALRVNRTDESLELVAGGKKRERLLVTETDLAGEELWVEGDRAAITAALAL